jgi:16S rRNA processing protein RimM
VVEQYYNVGVIAGTHGLRGEVRVLPKTDFPSERFKAKSKLFVRKEGATPFQEVTVKTARVHKQFYLITFEGMPSINDVEHWKGMELCVPEDGLMPLPEGTYYIHQLVGLKVYNEAQQLVGTLKDVLRPGANDVYVVNGPLQKQDVLIPAIPDCIKEVDLAKGEMTVHLLPGLLENDSDELEVED